MTYTDLPLDKFYQVVSRTTNEVIYGSFLWIEAAMRTVQAEESVDIYMDGMLVETYEPDLGWGQPDIQH